MTTKTKTTGARRNGRNLEAVPVIEVPIITFADGTPAKLAPDTNLIPWPQFIAKSIRSNPGVGFVMFGLAAAFGSIAFIYTNNVAPDFSLMATAWAVVAGVLVGARIIDPLTTRLVIVIHPDAHGEAHIDYQMWDRKLEATWPDILKLTMGKKRVMWLDAMNDDGIRPFYPWLAPIPQRHKVGSVEVLPVTGGRVFQIKAKMATTTRLLKYRAPDPREKFQQGMIAVVIGVCILAMIMAGGRVEDMFN